MVLKDWKRGKEKDTWGKYSGDYIQIRNNKYFYWVYHGDYFTNEIGYNLSGSKLKSKAQALSFAKRYMRTH